MRRREEEYVCVEREIVAQHVRVCVCVCVSSLRLLWDGTGTAVLVGKAFFFSFYYIFNVFCTITSGWRLVWRFS
jgi:hypothetical protein